MNEFLSRVRAAATLYGQSVATFARANRALLLSGLTIVSILLIVWARLGFSVQVGRFFAAEPTTTPVATIGTIPPTLNGAGLGTISGTATDAVGVTKMHVVIRRNFDVTTGVCADAQDWSGTAWVPACTTAGQIVPTFTPGTSVQWSVANTPPASQMIAGKYVIYVAAFRSESPLVWSGYVYKEFTFVPATAPVATPSVTINAVPPTLTGAPLGGITGSATDAVGVTKMHVVIRRNFDVVTGVCGNAQDWNGSAWVPACTVAGQIVPTFTPGTSVTWSTTSTPPLEQMTAGKYVIYAAAFRSDIPLVWSGYAYKEFTFVPTTPSPTATPVMTPTPTLVATPTPTATLVPTQTPASGTPTPVATFTPTPTATLTADPLAFLVSGHNLSTAGPTGTSVVATSNQQVQVAGQLTNTASDGRVVANVLVKAQLPIGLVYVPGSTQVNGGTVTDGVVGAGIGVGSLGGGQTMTVTFAVRVDAAQFPAGQSQAPIALQASATDLGVHPGQMVVVVNRTTSGVGTVQTGPGDAVVAALLVSGVVTLLYVTYTRSSAFRRRQATSVANERDPMDFRS